MAEAEGTGRRDRPLGAFRFAVEIQGLDKPVGRFQSVGGLSHEFEVVEHQEGGLNDRKHKLPGQGSYPNLVLKSGYLTHPMLEEWHRDFLKKRGPRCTVTVNLLDLAGKVQRTWSYAGCWPVKWEGPSLEASQAAISVQTVELAHEGPATVGG